MRKRTPSCSRYSSREELKKIELKRIELLEERDTVGPDSGEVAA
jgi:hypothetical protein